MARGDAAWVRSTLLKALAISATLAGATGVFLVLLAPFLIRLWVGGIVQTNYAVLAGLAVWSILNTVGNVVAMLLVALEQLRLQVVIAWCMAAANIFLSIYLTERYGIAGLIWGTVVSYAVCVVVPYSFLLPRLIRRDCPLPI